ncbi:MAG: acyl-CoA thioesterase [Planctomycetota bacterium]|nr:acyl-CoA thioesterase [Planctomycetota bacterium]MDA1141075.1 acyl-CoA thioesterase [Planctomycetota bacterium]
MHSIFEHHRIVSPDEIDELGHVGNVEYIRWMQEAAIAHSSGNGWSMERYRASGFSWVARSHFIEYRKPAFENDEITVHTWVANLKGIASLRKYKIARKRDNTVLAVAETKWVFIDLQTSKPKRVPSEVAAAYIIVGEEDEI